MTVIPEDSQQNSKRTVGPPHLRLTERAAGGPTSCEVARLIATPVSRLRAASADLART